MARLYKKDFVKFADALRRAKATIEKDCQCDEPVHPHSTEESMAVLLIAHDIAALLSSFNSEFDKVRFMGSCGFSFNGLTGEYE